MQSETETIINKLKHNDIIYLNPVATMIIGAISKGYRGEWSLPKLRRVGYSSLYPPQNCWHLARMLSPPQLLMQNCATDYDRSIITFTIGLAYMYQLNLHCVTHFCYFYSIALVIKIKNLSHLVFFMSIANSTLIRPLPQIEAFSISHPTVEQDN